MERVACQELNLATAPYLNGPHIRMDAPSLYQYRQHAIGILRSLKGYHNHGSLGGPVPSAKRRHRTRLCTRQRPSLHQKAVSALESHPCASSERAKNTAQQLARPDWI